MIINTAGVILNQGELTDRLLSYAFKYTNSRAFEGEIHSAIANEVYDILDRTLNSKTSLATASHTILPLFTWETSYPMEEGFYKGLIDTLEDVIDWVTKPDSEAF